MGFFHFLLFIYTLERGQGCKFYFFIFSYFFTIFKFFVTFVYCQGRKGAWVFFIFCYFFTFERGGGAWVLFFHFFLFFYYL